MPIEQWLLEKLRCPESHQPLVPADELMLARVNAQIRARRLRNRGGEVVAEPIREALVREDRKLLYVVDDDLAVMLIEQAIELQ